MTELVNSRTADVAQRDELMSGARASSCRLTAKRQARLEGSGGDDSGRIGAAAQGTAGAREFPDLATASWR